MESVVWLVWLKCGKFANLMISGKKTQPISRTMPILTYSVISLSAPLSALRTKIVHLRPFTIVHFCPNFFPCQNQDPILSLSIFIVHFIYLPIFFSCIKSLAQYTPYSYTSTPYLVCTTVKNCTNFLPLPKIINKPYPTS